MNDAMYEASAPVFARMLRNLSTMLDKAQAYATARKIDPAVLPAARLFPDMFALSKQVQIASDHAKGAVARLAGLDVPKYDDNEQTLEQLRARIDKTVAFIDSVDAARFAGAVERDIAFTIGSHDLRFKGAEYLHGFALPNFYFHLVTAYDILRHNGVEIGKRDYLAS